MNAQIQDVLHRGRKKHRQATGLKYVVALVGRCGAFRNVVVARHRNHTAPRRGAGHVGVFKNVGTTVNPWALAVPDAEHAIEFVRARRGKTQLLRAPQRRGRQLFVHARLENDVLRLEKRLGLLQRLVVTAQRRAPVAADETRRVFALHGVALALQHRQLHQRLHPAHEGPTVIERVFVVQRHRL